MRVAFQTNQGKAHHRVFQRWRRIMLTLLGSGWHTVVPLGAIPTSDLLASETRQIPRMLMNLLRFPSA